MNHTSKKEGRTYIMPEGDPVNVVESPSLVGHVQNTEMDLLKEVNQKLDLLLTSLNISVKE